MVSKKLRILLTIVIMILLTSENIEQGNRIGETDTRHSIDFTITTSNLENLCTNDDDDISDRIRSLNSKQRYIFDYVHKWARDYVKNQSCKVSKQLKLIHLFITGGAGVGKSHLMETIYFSVTKTLMYRGGDPDKPCVLLLAPTGVAAVNIDGNTIHSGLDINCKGHFFPLNDQRKTSLRSNLSEVRIIVIDEISMVLRKLFIQLNHRLIEIFGCNKSIPFAGLSVLVCGDLFQLPPASPPAVYCQISDIHGSTLKDLSSLELWCNFKIAELTEVMRQRGDTTLIDLLNKLRIGYIDDSVESVLKGKFIDQNDSNYHVDVLYIFAENVLVRNHNDATMQKLDLPMVSIDAIDQLPKGVALSEEELVSLRSRKPTDTGNLSSRLEPKVGARIMLIDNIDISDRLINGQIGVVKYIKSAAGKIAKICVSFDDNQAGSFIQYKKKISHH